MFLNDTFQHQRGAGVIPGAFRINQSDRPLYAYAQAIHFAAKNQRMRSNQVQFLQPLLQKLPGFKSGFFGRAFGFGLIGAEEMCRENFSSPSESTVLSSSGVILVQGEKCGKVGEGSMNYYVTS